MAYTNVVERLKLQKVDHSKTKQLFFGNFLTHPTPSTMEIKIGAVLVSGADGHGVIEKVDWTVTSLEEARGKFTTGVDKLVTGEGELKVYENRKGWFAAGFIDTHIHAPQYPNSGIFGKSTLLDWLETYTFPLESSLGNVDSPMYSHMTEKPDPLERAQLVYDRMINRTLSNGTTTASYYATLHVPATNLLADIAFDKGQRAYIGRVCMDNPAMAPDYYRDESAADALACTKATIEHCEKLDPTGELVAPIITPRFAPSCTPEALSNHGALAHEKNLRIQTHISENLNECKLVAELFPEQSTYAEVYDVHGLLTDRTILAHCVHLSDAEIELIKSRKSKVSHCPASNSALGSGLCPVRKLLDSGLDVGLGTDVSGGFHASILDSVRQAYMVGRHVGFLNNGDSRFNIGIAECLYLATVGGAKVVGMEGKLGEFKEGMYWDVQEISYGEYVGHQARLAEPVDMFGWESWEDKVAKWVWTGDDRNVKRVWVGGRLVHELHA